MPWNAMAILGTGFRTVKAQKERPPKGPLLLSRYEDAYVAVSVIVPAAPLL
jgi:hypothetical protein